MGKVVQQSCTRGGTQNRRAASSQDGVQSISMHVHRLVLQGSVVCSPACSSMHGELSTAPRKAPGLMLLVQHRRPGTRADWPGLTTWSSWGQGCQGSSILLAKNGTRHAL